MIRKPAVAGAFYPADPATLAADVDAMLRDAARADREIAGTGSGQVPRAVIVPHAGYVYSGSTAALAYARLAAIDPKTISKVVIVGPTHRVAVHGLAYSSASAFATPLGQLPAWPDTANALMALPFVHRHDETHRDEHAIEVQFPFLQRLFGEVPVVPLNAGLATGDQVADVLEVLDSPGTLIVISSDLSHYLPYDVANQIDAETIGQILQLAGPLDHEQACGATPINGILELARRRGWTPVLLGACNSGDGVGDKQRVVGYCAVEFVDSAIGERIETTADDVAKPLPDEAGPVLLALARNAVTDALDGHKPRKADLAEPWASGHFGTFVTLTQAGPDGHHDLRGCIGTLSDSRSLTESVPSNALTAAFRDPRFPPLSATELADTRFEVSVLSAAEPMDVHSEAEALAALRPGIDGVILSDGRHSATFLPQVWEELPDPKEFLAHLKAKAGIPVRHWGPNTRLQRYTVQAFVEGE